MPARDAPGDGKPGGDEFCRVPYTRVNWRYLMR